MKLRMMVLAVALAASPAWAADAPAPGVAADQGKAASKKETHINCLKETGSRIKPKEGECVEAPGKVITRDDIDRTGSTSTADAIRRLEPSAR
jgi:outer membrane cobalamin receptor